MEILSDDKLHQFDHGQCLQKHHFIVVNRKMRLVLSTIDSLACQSNIILLALSSGNCRDEIFPVVDDSEIGPFETHQGYDL